MHLYRRPIDLTNDEKIISLLHPSTINRNEQSLPKFCAGLAIISILFWFYYINKQQ